jgi:pantothenate synthetase
MTPLEWTLNELDARADRSRKALMMLRAVLEELERENESTENIINIVRQRNGLAWSDRFATRIAKQAQHERMIADLREKMRREEEGASEQDWERACAALRQEARA